MTERVSPREYHERTKHSPESLRADDHRLDFSNKPTTYKSYRSLPRVELARRVRPPQMPTLTAIVESRIGPGSDDSDAEPDSQRVRDLGLDGLTQLCYYAAGVTKEIRRGDRELLFRAAACTGALYHIDLYLGSNTYRQHIGTYLFERDFLLSYSEWSSTPLEQSEKLEQLRVLERGHAIRMIAVEEPTVGVDRPEDIETVEKALRERGHG